MLGWRGPIVVGVVRGARSPVVCGVLVVLVRLGLFWVVGGFSAWVGVGAAAVSGWGDGYGEPTGVPPALSSFDIVTGK